MAKLPKCGRERLVCFPELRKKYGWSYIKFLKMTIWNNVMYMDSKLTEVK